MRTKLLRNLILPLGDRLFGQNMMARLKFLESAQYWPREKIISKQSNDLQNLIQIAYHEVPFYQKLLDDKGIKPDTIRTKEDLARLPVVTKDMLRESFPHQTTRKTGQKTYLVSTSGSTGKNFYVLEDSFTAGWYRATFMLELGWAGWSIGEPHLQTGMTLNRSLDRRIKDRLFNCHYFSAYQLDDLHLEAILIEIEKYNLDHLWGYPGSLYLIAKYANRLGWNKPLKSIVSWGDTLFPHYRNALESVFHTKVIDTYGCAEGFHIAGQCGASNHYHTHDLDVIVEYLDERNDPVPYGRPGSVIITRLHPGPMPLIRYQVGDIATPKSGMCSCGRSFGLIKSIQGRDTDVIFTPDGNRLIVHFFTGILEHFSEIDSFQVVQKDINSILLLIVLRDNSDPTIQQRVINALKQKGTGKLKINIQIVDEIPLTIGGKRRFVISNLSQNND